MATETWQIGAVSVLASLILASIAYFGPILAPVRIWEEAAEAVVGGSSGAHDVCHLVYGTI